MKKHNLIWLVFVFLLLLGLSIPSYAWMKKDNHLRAQRRKSMVSPVIMVPGSSATIQRFNQLIAEFNKNVTPKHSVLKINVDQKGNLDYSGSIRKGDNEPFIIVGFSNNHDSYSNIKKQAGWLDQAFYQLMQDYRFNNFKAFGHSNGGLIWTYWLEHYYSDYDNEVKMKKLITLASPYNFSESNINRRTQMLNDFIKYRHRLPKSLKVISLSGGKSYESDGIVPEASVNAGKYIFQKQVKSYTAMTVTGSQADHTDLPQNRQVIAILQQYLLDKRDQRSLQPQRKH